MNMNQMRTSLSRFPYQGQIFIGLAALLWSSYGAVFRGVAIPSMQFLVIRALLTLLFLLPFIWPQLRSLQLQRDGTYFLLCGGAFALYTFGFILTTRNIGAAAAVSMQYSAPVYLFLAYLIRGRKLRLQKDLPKLIMTATLVVNGIWISMRVSSPSFLLPAYLCGVGFAVYTWSVKRLSHRSPLLVVASNNLLSLMFYIPFLFLLNEPFRALSGSEITAVILVALCVNTLSYVIFSAGMRTVKALDASFITLLEPMMNPVFVILILKEVPSAPDLIILALILGSLVVELMQSQKYIAHRRKVYEHHN